MNAKQIAAAWSKFWFDEGSPLPLALFRVVVGLIVLEFCLWIQPDWTTFFGQHAVVSPDGSALWAGTSRLNLLLLFPGDTSLIGMVVVLVMAGVCLTVGIFSRLSAFAVFLILLSLDARDGLVLHAGIRLLYVVCLFLAFSRCGEALSLGRLLRARMLGLSVSPISSGNIVAQRLIQVQMCIVYFSAFAGKLDGADWINGTAVYYATHVDNAVGFPLPLFDNLWCCQILSWGTLLLELSMFTLVWIKEFRYPVLAAGVIFHLGLEWALVIPLFQQIMIACYITFIDPAHLAVLMKRLQSSS